jgi:uncharacterized damage-inducible protein DinB
MSSLLSDPLGHNSWATRQVLDFCRRLRPEQLQATVTGTYGTILSTLQHIIEAEAGYRFRLSGDEPAWRKRVKDTADLTALAEMVDDMAAFWNRFIDADFDPDRSMRYSIDRSGNGRREIEEVDVKAGVLVAQVLNHGNEHRAQIFTILTTIGIEPPELDGWLYGEAVGRGSFTFRPADDS